MDVTRSRLLCSRLNACCLAFMWMNLRFEEARRYRSGTSTLRFKSKRVAFALGKVVNH